MFGDVLRRRSGRVIALGRLLFAAVFLLAIWIDRSQPAQAATATYGLLIFYVASALAVLALTYRNWWLDAKLAAPVHLLDIAVFTALVLTTEGYTSPFFVFFVFLILSAAIRWSWRETALTAVAVIALYMAAGLLARDIGDTEFEVQRFIIRSGHLVILSGLLIWFGVNQGLASSEPIEDFLPHPSLDDPPLERAIRSTVERTEAASGLLLWQGASSGELVAVHCTGGTVSRQPIDGVGQDNQFPRWPCLFDLARNRALARSPGRRMRFLAAGEALDEALLRRFGLDEGLAVPIRCDSGRGGLFLGSVADLGIDHLDVGDRVRAAIASYLDRHALLAAVQDSAGNQARLSLARDLHDSIVQFLAGATFRIEAIRRAARSGSEVEGDLKDLKQLMLHEQQELRAAIGALRNEKVALPCLAADLHRLCERLAQQWDISCAFSADVPDAGAPMRIHLDTHHLVREAVANAVRHGSARSVRVALSADQNRLRLDVSNDGTVDDRLAKEEPRSLRERVDEASGTLALVSRGDGTTVTITLPLGDAA